MSYIRNVASKWLPSGAVGVTVTSGFPPTWTNGAYVEVSASMAARSYLAAIVSGNHNIGATSLNVAVDVAVGTAGLEEVIATHRLFCRGGAGGSESGLIPFAVPMDKIPANSRVSLRVRTDSTSGTNTFLLSIGYYEGLEATHVTTKQCYELPVGSAGVSVTPSGTAWANSAWAQLTAGITTVIELALVCGYNGALSVEYELDIGTGSAGSETVITTVAGIRKPSTAAASGTTTGPYLPRPYKLDANTRVAIRLRKEGTNTTAWAMSAEYYDDPLTVTTVPPVVIIVPSPKKPLPPYIDMAQRAGQWALMRCEIEARDEEQA